MNTYVGITPTGIVIVKANGMEDALEKFQTHDVQAIHIIRRSVGADVWIKGKDAAISTKIRNID